MMERDLHKTLDSRWVARSRIRESVRYESTTGVQVPGTGRRGGLGSTSPYRILRRGRGLWQSGRRDLNSRPLEPHSRTALCRNSMKRHILLQNTELPFSRSGGSRNRLNQPAKRLLFVFTIGREGVMRVRPVPSAPTRRPRPSRPTSPTSSTPTARSSRPSRSRYGRGRTSGAAIPSCSRPRSAGSWVV